MTFARVCFVAFLFAFLTQSAVHAQDPVMIQGFYWNVRPGGVWYDTLQSRAAQLKRAGFSSIYYPPVYKGNAGGSDVGYTPYDWYDLGEYDSRGGNISSGGGSDIPTRYGTFSKLQSSINEYHAQGMQVYADIVINHREGGLLENNPFLSGVSCPPGGSTGSQTYTAFPLTSGSHRLAWTAGNGAQFFYPNASVNPGNTGDYCGPQFSAMTFYTNSFGQDVALHNNVGANLAMGDSMIAWGNWFTNRLGLDGYRIDNVKGIHHDYLARWGNNGVMAGKFMVGECYDGSLSVLQGWLGRMSGRANTSIFDFNLRFNHLKQMCDFGSSYDMRSLHTGGLMNNGTSSTQVVTFVDNHDFDRNNWQGVPEGSGHDPIVNNKKLAYAYILTHQGYPCVWWRDYFIYGVRDDINKLLGVRRWARGGQDYPTAYTGIDAPVFVSTDPARVYVMRRYGPSGSSADTTGILLMLNSGGTTGQVYVTAFGWAGKTLKDITGNIADQPTVAGDGRVLLKAPSSGYAVWVPSTFPSPYTANLVAAQIPIPGTVFASSIAPRAVYVNQGTLGRSNVLTTLKIAIGSTEVYNQAQTISDFPAGDSITVSYPNFNLTNNTTYTVTAIVAPVAGTPPEDDQRSSNFTTAFAPTPTVDGSLADAPYITLATKGNNNAGFGTLIDVSKIVYFPDVANQQLYVGVVGKLNPTNTDGMGLWLNFSETSGTPAGTALGGVATAGHYMEETNPLHSQFKADFEVDYMFALNTGTSALNTYVNSLKRVGGNTTSYLGNCGQSGAATIGPSGAGAFTANSVTFAFNNDGLSNHGFEMKIPFSELGITSAGNMQAFAMVVSATAFFSDVSVPGSVALSPLTNLGFNPDFAAVPGGPYHSTLSTLPVQLASFQASAPGNSQIRLTWSTVSETNNYGFFVQRRSGTQVEFVDIANGFVAGHGTTIEPQNYVFTEQHVPSGPCTFRLLQVDLDGMVHFSSEITVNILTGAGEKNLPSEYALHQNYPNPFNPTTRIRYDLPQAGNVRLSVFNTLGQVVKILVNEQQRAGFYETSLDGSNIACGLYLYKLETNNFVATRKLVLIK